MTLETLENKRKRLIFRSGHRGMKEMDLIMESFARKYIPEFTPEQLEAYEEFLEIPDIDLYNWFSRKEDVPAESQSELMDIFLVHKLV